MNAINCYKLLEANSANEFQKLLDEAVDDGWEPFGSVAISVATDGTVILGLLVCRWHDPELAKKLAIDFAAAMGTEVPSLKVVEKVVPVLHLVPARAGIFQVDGIPMTPCSCFEIAGDNPACAVHGQYSLDA